MKAFCALSCLLYLSTFSTPATSASYDCNKASTNVEHLICDSADLSKLDIDMAKLYRQNLKKDSDVKFEQRTWLKSVRNQCTTAVCLASVYQARVSALAEPSSQKVIAEKSANNLLKSEADLEARARVYALESAARIAAEKEEHDRIAAEKEEQERQAENQIQSSHTASASTTNYEPPNDWFTTENKDNFDDIRFITYGTFETLTTDSTFRFGCRLEKDFQSYGLGFFSEKYGKEFNISSIEIKVDENHKIKLENTEYGERNLERTNSNGYEITFYRANSARKRNLLSDISNQLQSGTMLLVRITDENGLRSVGEYSLAGFSSGYDDYKNNCQY